jgi:murein L,D-transpeptidase YcbB/YkuD
MQQGRFLGLATGLALLSAMPAAAQEDVAPAPAPAAQQSLIPPVQQVPSLGPSAAALAARIGVEAYYSAQANRLIWFRDAATRAAAAKLPAILRRAPLDGLADGPSLATSVEAALAGGQLADDKAVSAAWLRYVQALNKPVPGMSYGDPALTPKTPQAPAVLGEAAAAQSLAAHVDEVAAVNPLYSALRERARNQGVTDDPRVRATLNRLSLVPAKGRAILVDAASAQLWMLEDGRAVDSMKVIVGKKDAQTPLLAGTIHFVTFNPYWHIPQDVARRKVAPIVLKRGVSYLKAARYETVAAFNYEKQDPLDPSTIDWKAVAAGDTEVHIRQLTGPQNMMGKMKFGFVNDHGIFLHDTPHKELFAKAKRTLSLGCVRLEHPERLAEWLLGREATPPADGPEQLVQIDKGVPIYVTYLTATVADGQLAFADDVYGLDSAPASPPVATASAAH